MKAIQRLMTVGVVVLICGAASPVLAQSQAPMTGYQTRTELEIYNTEPGKPRGSVLDASNPIDLLNRLRRATALNDATDPVDAIDAALIDWDAQILSP
ncbi:MAG: hypothetical protein ACON4T_00015 [Synechococcus sp.]